MRKTILKYPFWLIELTICLSSVLVSLIAIPFIIYAEDDSTFTTVLMVVIPTIFISLFVSTPIVYSYRKIVSENFEMIDKLQKDPLTGLLNRHTFIPRYEKLVEELRINQKSVCLIMFDLDDFKKINDTYGHIAGDLVIFDSCQKIIESVRSTDLVCRFGGEEFLIVLWDLSFQQAEMLGNRLLHNLRSSVEYGDHQIAYTASIGLVYYKICTLKANDLIHEADLRMYQAKSEGKNKMISYFED